MGVLVFLCLVAPQGAQPWELLLQRHVASRKAVMQIYVETATYEEAEERRKLLCRRRFAIAPGRKRHTTFITPELLAKDPWLPEPIKRQIRDYYTDGKHFFSLTIANTDSVPQALPPNGIQQRRRVFFDASRAPHGAGADLSWELLESQALRKFAPQCLELDRLAGFYLEELISRSDKTVLQDEATLELHFTNPDKTKPVQRERLLVRLDPEHDYAVCEIRLWQWGARDELIGQLTVSVAEFARVNGVCWPKRVNWLQEAEGSSRRLVVEFTRIVVNQRLPAGAFDFRVPENAVVHQFDAPLGRKITHVLLYGKNNQVLRTFTPEEYEQYLLRQNSRQGSWLFWLLGAAGLVVLLVAGVLVRRRVRRLTPEPPRRQESACEENTGS